MFARPWASGDSNVLLFSVSFFFFFYSSSVFIINVRVWSCLPTSVIKSLCNFVNFVPSTVSKIGHFNHALIYITPFHSDTP